MLYNCKLALERMSSYQDFIEAAAFVAAGDAAGPWTTWTSLFYCQSTTTADFLCLWLGLVIIFTNLCCIVAAESCPGDHYFNSTEGECIPCSVCEQGQGTEEPCGIDSNTKCKPCLGGYYSLQGANGRECAECRNCTPRRTEVAPCSSVRDAVCGSCSSGYFLNVDGGGSECLPCSKCPPDGQVVYWADCAAAGLPEDQRCSPGLWTAEPGVATTTAQPTNTRQSSNTTTSSSKTSLPTNHGMFVPMATYESNHKPTPVDDRVERTIAIVSIVFTVATTVTFILSLTCLFREKLYALLTKCWRKKKKISRIIPNRKTHYPIQEQGAYVMEEEEGAPAMEETDYSTTSSIT